MAYMMQTHQNETIYWQTEEKKVHFHGRGSDMTTTVGTDRILSVLMPLSVLLIAPSLYQYSLLAEEKVVYTGFQYQQINLEHRLLLQWP